MTFKLEKYIQISGTLTCKSGLRIGGSKDDMEIGGMDHPIIRHPLKKHPYIPGSSIKGKLRSLLEYDTGKYGKDGEPCGCAQEDCLVCRIFGPHKSTNHKLGPTRIIVRDAPLNDESVKELEEYQESEGLHFSEIKTENIINRETGTAAHKGLRTLERVPAGAKFDFNISLRIFKDDNENDILNFVKKGLEMLPKDTLGGSGTRGYGWMDVQINGVE